MAPGLPSVAGYWGNDMAIRPNRYNDPSLGAAFENIASLFAPMSGSDLAGYATADLTRQKAAMEAQKNQALADYFGNPAASADARDHALAGLGIINPTQGFGARDMGHAATLRGQDIDSGDRRYTSDNTLRGTMYTSDNALRGSVLGNIGKPVGQGEVAAIPDEVLAWAGLDGASYNVAGAAKPLTEAEVKGGLLSDMAGEDPDWARWVMGGSKDPLAVQGPDGPVMAAPDRADGMGVYEKPGAAKLTNVQLPDGSQTVAVETPDGLVDPQSGAPMPPGTTMYSTSAQGSADEVLSMGSAVRNRVDTQGMAAASALDTIGVLEEMITTSPSAQGLVGTIRGTAQNMMQTGNELGRFMGGTTAEVADAVSQGLVDAGIASEMFDPNISAIDMLMNSLAWQVAKGFSGDRVSNEQLRVARQMVGSSGMFNNQANSLTRLGQLRDTLTRDLSRVGPALSPEVQVMVRDYWAPDGTAAPAAAPPPSTPAVPAVGTVEDGYRFLGGDPTDPNSWEPVQ